MQGLQTKFPITVANAILAAALLLGGQAHAAPAAATHAAKTDSALTHTVSASPKRGWISVIARTAGAMTPGNEARLRALSADITRRLTIIDALELRLPTKNLARLAALPFVTHLSADCEVTKCDEFTVGHTGADVAAAQYGVSGNGITVAVVDSGSRFAHPDLRVATNFLKRRVIASPDFVTASPAPKSQVTTDMCGHGSHVIGIIGGNGHESNGSQYTRTFRGIAPQANLVSVRVLDSLGRGVVGDVVAGLQWCVTNKSLYKIRVINLSLGHPVGESYTTDPLCQAVEAAYRAGIVVVCAAGNDGRLNGNVYMAGLDNEGWGTAYGTINSPANDPYVITVGATKQMDTVRADDRIATYSSRGPSRLDLVLKPDIIAPGNRIISLDADNASYLYQKYAGNQIPLASYSTTGGIASSPAYYMLSGTSMAAPVVAGAAALMLERDPTLTPDTVKVRLMLSADKWGDPLGNPDPLTYGAGSLDIPAALACTAVAGQPAMSPDMSVDSAGNVYVNIDRACWGKASLWSTGSLTDLRAIWGNFAIAGTSANVLSGSRAIWGKSVWSDRTIAASTSSTTSSVDLSSVALNGE